MISVLIPIYNQKITKLVKDLLQQSNKYDIPVEVIALDDKSRPSIRKHNAALLHVFNVNYVELSENIGRSKIRNWLVKLARYDHLLFLDCDSQIVDDLFLVRYKESLPADVIYGGRIYPGKKPRTPKKMLHWKYGTFVESQPADKRNKSPFLSFMSNNFLVAKKIIKKHPFNEKVQGYGYEDLIWARGLQTEGIKVLHINNPVLHKGIETYVTFMNKTLNALKNLDMAHEKGWLPETRLLKTSRLLNRCRLRSLFKWWYDKNEAKISESLQGNDPSLRYFSMWKLRKLMEVRDKRKAPDRGPSQLLHY
jgi:glycosyltransferase involved in cell wall biosynthesis